VIVCLDRNRLELTASSVDDAEPDACAIDHDANPGASASAHHVVADANACIHDAAAHAGPGHDPSIDALKLDAVPQANAYGGMCNPILPGVPWPPPPPPLGAVP
jgi:hypothetical protein